MNLLDRKEFSLIKRQLKKDHEQHEAVFNSSRDMTRSSKQAVYSLHRGDMKTAAKLINEAERLKKSIDKVIRQSRETSRAGHYRAAQQEYAEACAYQSFLAYGTIPSMQELGVEYDDYLAGLCDFTGELVRKAVDMLINGDVRGPASFRDFVAEFYGQMLGLDLPNNELRKKADSVRWNLNKLEDMLLTVSYK